MRALAIHRPELARPLRHLGSTRKPFVRSQGRGLDGLDRLCRSPAGAPAFFVGSAGSLAAVKLPLVVAPWPTGCTECAAVDASSRLVSPLAARQPQPPRLLPRRRPWSHRAPPPCTSSGEWPSWCWWRARCQQPGRWVQGWPTPCGQHLARLRKRRCCGAAMTTAICVRCRAPGGANLEAAQRVRAGALPERRQALAWPGRPGRWRLRSALPVTWGWNPSAWGWRRDWLGRRPAVDGRAHQEFLDPPACLTTQQRSDGVGGVLGQGRPLARCPGWNGSRAVRLDRPCLMG